MYSFATYYSMSYFDALKICSLSAIFLIFEQCISYLHEQENSYHSIIVWDCQKMKILCNCYNVKVFL